MPYTAPARITPTIAACSRPPICARTPRGSSGLARAIAPPSTLTLSSSLVVDARAAARGLLGRASVKAEMRQAAGVVFPMPMSPVTRRSTPALDEFLRDSRPRHHSPRGLFATHCGPATQVAGPAPHLRGSQQRMPLSPTTPTSRTLTLAPTVFAMAFTAAPPAQKLLTIAAVTAGATARHRGRGRRGRRHR